MLSPAGRPALVPAPRRTATPAPLGAGRPGDLRARRERAGARETVPPERFGVSVAAAARCFVTACPLDANPRHRLAPIAPTLSVPLPVRCSLHFGAPIRLRGPATPMRGARLAARVRGSLDRSIQQGLAARSRVSVTDDEVRLHDHTRQGGGHGMHPTRMTAALLAATFTLGGCTTLRENRTACRVASTLTGATLGAVGGGVGTYNIEKGPDKGETAAGAGVGLVAGSLIGFLVGQAVCPEPPPPPPPPRAVTPPPPAGTKIAELRSPYFDFNKSQLKPEGERKVGEAVTLMKQQPNMRVSVEGHTDSVGSDAYNMKLGQRRADTVKQYMVRQGIEPGRITARSFGESRPVASNKTEDGRAQNRRVEIIVQ